MLFEDLKFMSIEDLTDYVKSRKSGVFTKIKYATKIDENTFKIVEMVVRLRINYYHLQKVLEKAKTADNTKTKTFKDIILLENTLFYNENTDKTRLRCYTTKHIAKSTYYHLGNEIGKQMLIDMGIVKDKPKTDLVCFTINANNIISIG